MWQQKPEVLTHSFWGHLHTIIILLKYHKVSVSMSSPYSIWEIYYDREISKDRSRLPLLHKHIQTFYLLIPETTCQSLYIYLNVYLNTILWALLTFYHIAVRAFHEKLCPFFSLHGQGYTLRNNYGCLFSLICCRKFYYFILFGFKVNNRWCWWHLSSHCYQEYDSVSL